MLISQIVAISENRVIAIEGKLPWHLPADLKYFKDTTWGHHILMGRKNYEAEGRILKGRTNIIITRRENYKVNGAYVFSTIEKGIEFARQNGEKELFVVGGGEIYKQTLSQTDKLYITVVHKTFDGDTFYPEIDAKDWNKISERMYIADDKNPVDHTYFIYEKVNS